MSYRTTVNGTQIFGNNEYYIEWENFIKSQGIEINEDGCYDGEITDVMGMFDVIDKITRRLIDERHKQVVEGKLTWDKKPYKELTDLSESMWLDDKTPILEFNIHMIEHAYCFLPYQLFKAVEDIVEKCNHDDPGAVVLGYRCYRLKDGEKIRVHAG